MIYISNHKQNYIKVKCYQMKIQIWRDMKITNNIKPMKNKYNN